MFPALTALIFAHEIIHDLALYLHLCMIRCFIIHSGRMSSRVTRLKSQKFQDNIAAKRGTVAVAEEEVRGLQTQMNQHTITYISTIMILLFVKCTHLWFYFFIRKKRLHPWRSALTSLDLFSSFSLAHRSSSSWRTLVARNNLFLYGVFHNSSEGILCCLF